MLKKCTKPSKTFAAMTLQEMWKRCFKQFHNSTAATAASAAYFHCKKMDMVVPIQNPGYLLKVFHSVITECHSVSEIPLIFTI